VKAGALQTVGLFQQDGDIGKGFGGLGGHIAHMHGEMADDAGGAGNEQPWCARQAASAARLKVGLTGPYCCG
jgi:hypothetical protein